MEVDETEHYITCPVCYLQFDEDKIKPKLLSCSHTVCLQCLKTIFNHGAVITCPVCRRSDRLQYGVEKLPTNQAVLHIIQLNEKLKCQRLTCLSESLKVESLVKELLDFYSPEETAFFDKLQTIIQFVAKDPNKCLEPVWKIQDSWPKDDNGILVFKLHQCVLSCVNELAPEHVDFLISDIQARWITSGNAQRYAMLNFVRTLAIEGNHDGHTPEQILDVIGEFVRCPDTPVDLVDPCIECQYKILDHYWNSDLVSHWILNCIHIIQQREHQRSVTAAMKLMRHLCYLFAVKSAACNDQCQQSTEFTELVWLKYRETYEFLDKEWQLLDQAVAEIVSYMEDVRSFETDETHSAALQERLTFILMILKYGHLVLKDSAAVSVWTCLVDGAASGSDSETCFKWFEKVIELNAMDSKGHQSIFHHHILKLDPRRMNYQTDSFIDCFQRFFRAVQCSDGDTFTDDVINPIPGLEFLWKIVQYSDRSVAQKAYDLLKETIVYLGPRLFSPSIQIGDNVIGNCLDRLRDESFDSRRIPRCLSNLAGNQRKLMDRLAAHLLLEEEKKDIPQSFQATADQHRQELTVGIHTILSLPLKFDVNRSIFLLTVTKRGRLIGRIHIKPWALFGSSKFIQELGDFCIGNPRKIGRRVVKSTGDTFVRVKMKNAMFQPVVPDLLNYSIWLDSELAEKSCQVGITGIQSSSSRGGGNNRRVTGWQFVFLLRDMSPGNQHHQTKKSLRFGDVVQGIDVVKSLCCSRILSSHFSDGLRLTLEAI